MTRWESTPEWIDVRTLRWVARQLESDAQEAESWAKRCEALTVPGSVHPDAIADNKRSAAHYRTKAAGLRTNVLRLTVRADRIEQRIRGALDAWAKASAETETA